MLLERFYEGNHIEIEIRSEMEKLINNYSFKNKKTLRERVKITWTDASY
jgi:ferredoxin-NADP reductase